ncbi:Protein kinase-like domain superfamily [Arabidopsis suecica]|uniref:Protein kinase superfamily protein n=2 Tax=Arabidopsis TaxID=3701 RepID=B3H756_ARATH|nr:Protein kinase superfamily protein [Arabidopsis thaliana]AED95927.1 Protein kinase superfamily protein [Arabidopsis thaliana]KAG7612507.1 Protein kinase-like domain superfamily [Arabidopsis suecica]|eukprot:NP_001119407.1 Protein kinase superfamily protein [Arabidopsis thaliana]
MHGFDFKEIQEKISDSFRPWQRSFQFWVRATNIYTGYKVFQLRVSLVKDAKKQEEMWERQHEQAADKIYFMCSDLGGFFLKIAQLLAKPDMAPAAWVKKLVTLCDQAPATPFDAIQLVLEKELGKSIGEIFETFDEKPLGSASIAQVQHPGIERLMMTDIRNLQLFALYMQRTDIKFDLHSITKEMEKQIGYEFDFKREANAMERIRCFLYENNKKSPVLVPRVLRDMVTKRVLVMEYINGIPILSIGDEMAKRGINPHGKIAEAAKHNILNSLSRAYGQMILKSGFFHADPHPGNILICKGQEVALLDYGQVKELPNKLRLGYANLVIAMADNNASRVSQSFWEMGLHTVAKCENEQQELLRLAQTLFDTKMPTGQTVLQPFSDDSSIKKIAVETFPEELFSVLRTVVLLRGLSVGMGVNYSCAEQWRAMAEEALLASGRVTRDGKERSRRRASLRRLRTGS